MTALVLLEFDASGIKQPSRSAVAAAAKLGEVHALVAGSGVDAAAQAAAKLPGVAKVLTADAPALDHLLAEPTARAADRVGAELRPSAGRDHRGGQERHAARRRTARRAADQRHRRCGRRRHLRPADLCRQRHGDGQVVRWEEGHHRPRRQLRPRGGRRRQCAGRGRVDPRHACDVTLRLRRAVEERAARTDRRPRGDFWRPRHADRR